MASAVMWGCQCQVFIIELSIARKSLSRRERQSFFEAKRDLVQPCDCAPVSFACTPTADAHAADCADRKHGVLPVYQISVMSLLTSRRCLSAARACRPGLGAHANALASSWLRSGGRLSLRLPLLGRWVEAGPCPPSLPSRLRPHEHHRAPPPIPAAPPAPDDVGRCEG